MKSIDKMDRLSIIELGKEKLDKHLDEVNAAGFDYSLIDTVRILKNKYRYIVRFEQLIKFVPINSSYYYGFDIDLIDNTCNRISVENGNSINNLTEFFRAQKPDKKKIDFVMKSLEIENSNESVLIFEKESYYEIKYISSGEKVDKLTGEKFDWWDRILEVDPDNALIDTKLK